MAAKGVIITIDGPAGAGKSTISQKLAARLHYTYLDTGAMYRAVGLRAQRAGIDLDSAAGVARLSQVLNDLDLRFVVDNQAGEGDRIIMDGEDVSDLIRTAEMGLLASRVSAEKAVRDKLTALQRNIGGKGFVVAEGRDMGTVVFPGAEYKFYLEASPAERARRRREQLLDQGQCVDYEEILQQILKRDEDDSARALAPLRPAADAVVIDSTAMSIEEVLHFMMVKVDGLIKSPSMPSRDGTAS